MEILETIHEYGLSTEKVAEGLEKLLVFLLRNPQPLIDIVQKEIAK